MPFKVTGYTRLENRYTIEVSIWNDTVGMPARLLIEPSEWKVYFNGRCCDVPRLCKIMDEVNKPCAEMTVEIEDATATTVKCAYFSLSESTVHSWVTGHPGSIRHKVTRERYGNEFTLTIEELFNVDGRGNGVYFGDGNTRVYLNGKGSWAWSDIFLEGNKVKKISWHWHYCATMDKYVKWLSEVWFVNTEAEKEKDNDTALHCLMAFDENAGVTCRITRVDRDYQKRCYFVYLLAVDCDGKEHCYQFKIPDNGPFNIIGGKRSDLNSWITFSKWHVKGITYIPSPKHNGYDILMSMSVVDRADVYTVPSPKYDINVLTTRIYDQLGIKPEDTNTATYIKNAMEQWAITQKAFDMNLKYGIKPVEFIPYDPSEFEFKPNINKEETKMSKTIKEVWDSMTREQQDACCVLIGEAAKKNSSLDYEIKKKVAAMKAREYMIRVTGSDIRDIVFNGPATIILWRDGSKTVIKQQKGDKWDPEKAVAMAVMKKVFGTNATGSNYLEFVKPYIEKALEEDKKRKAAARRKKRAENDSSK